MAKLHLLVSAVLIFVRQSTVCVEWMIVNPPIIFGKTAQLSCTVTPNISSNTHNITSWTGGKDYAILTITGGTADPIKYTEIRRWHRNTFESILQIHKFDEMDVNVDYSCSIGGLENRKMLSLALDKFEYHPDKDITSVLASFRNGYLDVIMRISKVYPIPNCTIMFNGNIISRRLTTETSVNGIFYTFVEEAEHYFDVCSGKLIVTCVVGKTEIPIYQKSLNRCTKKKKESKELSDDWIIYISVGVCVLLFAIVVIGVCCLAKYGNLRNVRCCSVCQDHEGARNDARDGENQEMV